MATELEVDAPRRPSKAELRRYAVPNCQVEPVSGERDDDDKRTTPDDLIPGARDRIARAKIRHLSAILKELNSLRSGPEQDDYGILRPSPHAYDEASGLLVDAAIAASHELREIPLGKVSTDGEGGVRIEWVRPDRSVHLVVPSTPDSIPYIYHECGDVFDTENASADRLAHRLIRIE